MSQHIQELRPWLAQWPAIYSQFDLFVTRLRRRQITGSDQCARATIELLRNMLGTCRWTHAEQLMQIVRLTGQELTAAQPSELAVGNVVRRALFIIREEYSTKLREQDEQAAPARPGPIKRSESLGVLSRADSVDPTVQQPSLGSVLNASHGTVSDFSVTLPDLRQSLMEVISELKDEIEHTYENLCEQALEHIHTGEIILTYGASTAVELFLKRAAQKRSFQVVIAEGEPGRMRNDGHEMAKRLADDGLTVTLIPNTSVFAIMARVNKVLLPTHAVMADGGIVSFPGTHIVALAAKEFSLPVVCLAALHQVTPLFLHNQTFLLNMTTPSDVLKYTNELDLENIETVAAEFDYIPPELVDLYVTNIGGHQPSYIYRILADWYHPEDYDLQLPSLSHR